MRDLTAYRIEDYMAVPKAFNEEAYRHYKQTTPARIGIWRSGPRYKTETMLRFRADHAVAQDAVFTDVSEEFIEQKGWAQLKTVIESKEEYLKRPDLGRILDDESISRLKEMIKMPPKVQVYISDGLSSTAIETNAYDTYQSIAMRLSQHNIQLNNPFFVKYGRVPCMDHISELIQSEVTAVLIGERPGLATGESMSCYMIYKGRVGNPESRRMVVSNIHKNGTPAVEAGAHIGDLVKKMLDEKKSGVALK
ncbi:ethanolamine ammonia-lyase light chain [Natranaerovirga hydrolytica]|uniref:Ethanolamine ammonia-lyase small subunit n=1 Tax=Natranaerovirga hydrolytica TaxID=680378 RepID=A0A4R1N1H0_9FIRM|nr:ethanolamine ammonia-lyase subunit EutC [Natranaerovirga hydrolytica]TCK98800.1 ethanolamine ammonia-lyase light chain [Natranaerovirga hydrolytica]